MNYIPQAAPFIMIDTIETNHEGKIISETLIDQHNVLVENGYFTEAGLLENMAQTAAGSMGKVAFEKGQKPPIGFIGAIKNIKIMQLPRVGQLIQTHLTPVTEIMNAQIVKAEVKIDKQAIASAEFTIFIQS